MMEKKGMDIQEIMDRIPHRYPFLLIDRILDHEEAKWITALKNVTVNENFFPGHFPENPIMPGVLIIEALAQAGGVLAMADSEKDGKTALFMTIDKAKFRRPVRPGDQLILKVEVLSVKRGTMVKVHGTATVDGNMACEADLMFAIVDGE